MEGVTSGADATAWEPITIEERQQEEEEEEESIETEARSDKSDETGVTSGSDSARWNDVKSSKRKNRKP